MLGFSISVKSDCPRDSYVAYADNFLYENEILSTKLSKEDEIIVQFHFIRFFFTCLHSQFIRLLRNIQGSNADETKTTKRKLSSLDMFIP